LRWPVLLAIGLGVLLLGAGVLLFVAANWDEMSPGSRFGLLLGCVGGFHLAGALAGRRFPPLGTGLHAAGSIALGGAIFLTGQIFHLAEHWPGGLLLWLLGAAAGLLLLRDWPHVVLVALLAPAWLSGEWVEATRPWSRTGITGLMATGWLLLSLTYLSAEEPGSRSAGPPGAGRRALVWLGSLAVIPATLVVALMDLRGESAGPVPGWLPSLGWAMVLGLPLALAFYLRGRAAAWNLVAAVWVVALHFASLAAGEGATLAVYGLCGAGALGLIGWGLVEGRPERVNLGVAGFAITVVAYYFAEVMDKLDRSVSLIVFGLLFLAGSWFLERTRRRLLARMAAGRGVSP
jgi:uncharacterized membrane protein